MNTSHSLANWVLLFIAHCRAGKIQGWCVKTTNFTVPKGLRVGFGDNSKIPKGGNFLGRFSNSILDDIPCNSLVSLEFLVPYSSLRACCSKWQAAVKYAGYFVLGPDCGTKIKMTPNSQNYRCTDNWKDWTKSHCKNRLIGPTKVPLESLRSQVGSITLSMYQWQWKGRNYYAGGRAWYEAWGDVVVAIWYKPPLGELACSTPPGTIQFTTS